MDWIVCGKSCFQNGRRSSRWTMPYFFLISVTFNHWTKVRDCRPGWDSWRVIVMSEHGAWGRNISRSGSKAVKLKHVLGGKANAMSEGSRQAGESSQIQDSEGANSSVSNAPY
jgi:hypothetical protein